jgi:hypothetical protein
MSTETIQWISDPKAYPEVKTGCSVECLLTLVARHSGQRFVRAASYWPEASDNPLERFRVNGYTLGVMGWDLVAWAAFPKGFENQ